VVGLIREVELIGEMSSVETWNPLHLAIYFKKMDIVKFYLEDLRVNPRLALLGPVDQDHSSDLSS